MIKIERSDTKNAIRTVEVGDLVLIDNEPHLVTLYNNDGECRLVGLNDGNRWNDEALEEGINYMELSEYIDDPEVRIELIKKNRYEMTINIK